MSFDQATRNRLARFVSDARVLLTEEFTRQLQNEYGLDPTSGTVTPLEKLSALDDARRETARILRETMRYYQAGNEDTKKSRQTALDRILREQSFTVLNRLCALRMAEAREIILQAVGAGYQSKGFRLYATLAGTALGETGDAYRAYLFSLFDELAIELPPLFDRFNPEGRLFPRQSTLLALLDLINDPEVDTLWAEDETVGWIYQYFNSQEERRAMRAASSAPRNSRELAVRNQFFTPRYVVEFLTDNTLGRIWFEMTRGETGLVDYCNYLVRRPTEIFLNEGQEAPEQENSDEDLSQEELPKQPVYIPYRPLKDPREIKMLDPACGSMHFGLYAFDLFEHIYSEAWDLEETLKEDALWRLADLEPLHATYPDKATFLRDVPRLIIECNIHGIDIDPRAVQIAGLSLWLRAQKSWRKTNLPQGERPQIRKSNIVCAEPMPGDQQMLEDFLSTLDQARLETLLRESLHLPLYSKLRVTQAMADALKVLVHTVWDEMELAGEAGSLLKIEETLRDAIAEARKASEAKSPLFQLLDYGLGADNQAGLDFWDHAENLVLVALQTYAEETTNGVGYRRRLFTDDAAQGFSFIQLCKKRYDVALMNPPFGEMTMGTKSYLEKIYPNSKSDIYTCFVDWACTKGTPTSKVGVISNRTFLTLKAHTLFRENVLMDNSYLDMLADLGSNVLDNALVEVASYVVSVHINYNQHTRSIFFPIHESENKNGALLDSVKFSTAKVVTDFLEDFIGLPNTAFSYWLPKSIRNHFRGIKLEGSAIQARVGLQTSHDNRFARLKWEIPSQELGINKNWVYFAKGGEFSPFHDDVHLVVNWGENGKEINNFVDKNNKKLSVTRNSSYYFLPGLTYPWRTSLGFAPRAMPANCIFAAQGSAMFALDSSDTPETDLLSVLGALNSSLFQEFISIGVGAVESAARSYQVGLVQELPWLPLDETTKERLANLAEKCVRCRRQLDFQDETTNLFTTVSTSNLELDLAYKGLIEKQKDIIEEFNDAYLNIDAEILSIYKILSDEIESVSSDIIASMKQRIGDKVSFAKSVVSYWVGLVLGRWNIRHAIDNDISFNLPNTFTPLPVCPPGMLQNKQDAPAKLEDISTDYPLRISWQGILVDDNGHAEDVVERIRDVLYITWKERAEAIEAEACEILGIKSLREYFKKTDFFFDDHLKRYSKSRRQAPIYWPLSTPSGSYTLWLYYHRINDQILFTCVNDFVDPKLKQVTGDINRLRQKSKRSRDEENELERLVDFEVEMKDFREELLRVAAFWKPNLNDGVQITAAPLWRLFQHNAWQKRLRETWEKLEEGDYDWAHLAYSIWPGRVRAKCKTDKSLAIAHDLENIYMETAPKAGKKDHKTKSLPEQDELDLSGFEEE